MNSGLNKKAAFQAIEASPPADDNYAGREVKIDEHEELAEANGQIRKRNEMNEWFIIILTFNYLNKF